MQGGLKVGLGEDDGGAEDARPYGDLVGREAAVVDQDAQRLQQPERGDAAHAMPGHLLHLLLPGHGDAGGRQVLAQRGPADDGGGRREHQDEGAERGRAAAALGDPEEDAADDLAGSLAALQGRLGEGGGDVGVREGSEAGQRGGEGGKKVDHRRG